MALPDPAGLVLAAAVLQVEHRIPLRPLLVVTGRRVDQRVAPRAGHLRVVPDLADLSVRHVLDRVVGRAGLGTSTALAYLLPPKNARLPVSAISTPSTINV